MPLLILKSVLLKIKSVLPNNFFLIVGVITGIFLYVGFLNYKNDTLHAKLNKINVDNAKQREVILDNQNKLVAKAKELENKTNVVTMLNNEKIKVIYKEKSLQENLNKLPKDSYSLTPDEISILNTIGDENAP